MVENQISYRVQHRPSGPVWAVLRTGPRGGERLIAVYDSVRAAVQVAEALESEVNYER